MRRLKRDTTKPESWIREASTILNELLSWVDGNQKSVSANYTTTVSDRYVLVTDTTSPRTITLLQRAAKNFQVTVKDMSGGAGTNNITVSAGGSEAVDGGTSTTISTNYGSVTLVSDGDGTWMTI